MYAVAGRQRGNAAVAAVPQHEPALMVLDVMLPGASGLDICKAPDLLKLKQQVIKYY